MMYSWRRLGAISSKFEGDRRRRLKRAPLAGHSSSAHLAVSAQAQSKHGVAGGARCRHQTSLPCTIIVAIMAAGDSRDLTENELMDEIKARASGWENHFETLYLRYRRRLVRYFLVRGLTPEDAEDGAETCFYKVLDSASGFNGDLGIFRAWLFTIAHHEWINIIRVNRRYADYVADDDEEEARDIAVAFAASDQRVDITLENQELIDLLHTCISLLKPKEREVIALYLEEMPHKDIALLLNISENFSMVLRSLTLAKLRKSFFELLQIQRIDR